MSVGYRHVDVFATGPYTGNSLAVFGADGDLPGGDLPAGDVPGGDLSGGDPGRGPTAGQLLAITQEVRHFESVFLAPPDAAGVVPARVFDLFGELDFAGHPVLGAAAVLHERAGGAGPRRWTFRLPGATVGVTTTPSGAGFTALLDQGPPRFLGEVPAGDRPAIAAALSLPAGALADLPLEVVSTGLSYLIVPVTSGLPGAGIAHPGFGALLERYGARFAYLLDLGTDSGPEGRSWNNDGVLEDVATGSAAGCVGAYLARHGLVPPDAEFTLAQGRFAGRPSLMRVMPQGPQDALVNVRVGGEVAFVAAGRLDRLPPPVGGSGAGPV
ncbi:PhzF family phenazine biosynthesis protein [Streptomyces liangshanensis]|uniref:PhzF family phenazine biosynthesis protein n=1 Tax=Streptomyces liangshanensis TaxID=2717324 RepID=A0A6G9GVC8_9ACTN|nr:PhzF family phenazine biosynthesis protein [Streptomyces liangshanensis]QIQ01961.1 PhzF family phenazine biosynthesis protein [Streptomyces liangshanensis]